MPQDNYERIPATKIDILSLKEGEFIENKEQWQPNYLKTIFGFISRINMIGIVVSKNDEDNSIVIDDGTSSIYVNFNFAFNYEIIEKKNIIEGDLIIVIGRPRKYEDDIYITAEIINKIDNLNWIKYRKIEIEEQKNNNYFLEPIDSINRDNSNFNISNNNDNNTSNKKTEEDLDIYELTQAIINNNDNGEGVDIEKIELELEKLNVNNPKEFVKRLLEQGDLFEIRPGKLKLL